MVITVPQAATNYRRVGRVALEPCNLHTAAKSKEMHTTGAAVAGREQWQSEQRLASRENACLN